MFLSKKILFLCGTVLLGVVLLSACSNKIQSNTDSFHTKEIQEGEYWHSHRSVLSQEEKNEARAEARKK